MTETTAPGCKQCSTPLVRKDRGPASTYCSANCRARAKYIRARADGRYEAELAASRAKNQAKREANAKPCPYCGDPMAHPRRVQCGKPECKRLWTNERQRRLQQKYKAETGQYSTRKYKYECVCCYCERRWQATKSKAKYCSSACQAAAEHGPDRKPKLSAAQKRRLRAQRALDAAASGTRGGRIMVAGPCGKCGTHAIAKRPSVSGRHYCSDRCYRREKTLARRARSRNVHVDRQAIYRRDKWTCRLCNKPVARTKRVPHPKAPVLDHIVPLADGGEHEPANLQLTHFICNSAKRNYGGGEQLMLIG